MTGGIERLTAALDYDTQAVLYSFTQGTAIEQPFKLVTAPVAFAGRDYGYDPLGRRHAPVAPGRQTVWKFLHPYIGTEHWSSLKAAMIGAMGHGRKFWLQKQLADGTTLVEAPCRLVDFPDSQEPVNKIYAESSLTFAQYADWQSIDISSPRWDTGLRWDSGLRWDTFGFPTAITAQNVPFTLTNLGDVNEYAAIFTLVGPIGGNFALVNQSCDIRGAPLNPGAAPCRFDVPFSIPSGQYLIVDSGRGAVYGTIPGLVPWTAAARWPGQEFFFALVPGANACFITQATSTTGGIVSVAFRSKYR